ncbi:MAG TPA: TAT-variant-translocated molybdopterin oxidoreductase [Pyrinomonadaceae bacterium]|nr:TAT-variant-translocated molybdopterin oxidoreductase [Pyrinomonadaceae bacterium]
MSTDNKHINFTLMRQYILDQQDAGAEASASGTRSEYWRSIEELADSPVLREFIQREFPQKADVWDDPVERRTFLKLMGASLALAGLSGCVYQPPEKIVPYVRQPEEIVPGKALFFATAFSMGGVAVPLLVRSNEGRPTKIEGNPDHPINRSGSNDRGSSATDIYAQASILTLYDPDRSKTTLYRDETRPWTTFVGEIRTLLDEQRGKQGSGIRFLTETITSPTVGAQLRSILTEFPQAKWHQYEPSNDDNARAGAVAAFGQPVNTIYNFAAAQRILALDSDFLACGPGTVRYAREFAPKRKGGEHGEGMNRLYVVESTPTTTGARADHVWRVKPSEIEGIARTAAERISGGTTNQSSAGGHAFLDAILKDLQSHRGASIVIPGREASPTVHALAHAMNSALDNIGRTVSYTDPLEANSVDQRQSLQELVNDIDGGRVELLVIVGGNPVYNTPADLKLNQERMFKVRTRIHFSLYRDETSELCHWHVPESHYLESWSDARSYDGTVSIVQPLIEPLYQNKSVHEFLAVFTPQYDRIGYDIVREHWQRRTPTARAGTQTNNTQTTQAGQTVSGDQAPPTTTSAAAATPDAATDFENSWRQWVHDGFIPNTAFPTRSLAPSDVAAAVSTGSPAAPAGSFELVLRTDPTIYDGRFANNGWLQELPKPLTKLTWDNAVLLSPNTASRLGLQRKIGEKGGDVNVDTVAITHQGRSMASLPAWVIPGHPDDVITIHLGYGRKLAGRVGNQHGFNAYELRMSDSPWFATGVKVERGTGQYQLAATQLHFLMEGRDIVRSHNVGEDAHAPNGHHEPSEDETLYDPKIWDSKNQGMGYAWGMAIDLSGCVGCNACTVACQSENNIPVVGKQEVARSREMHWIRVDTYFKGDDASHPESTHFMPVPCMHCEKAPCEPVCPVHATVHSSEGLNDMVYNRCVGTKYCSNNCPYKVRRFNFFLYQDWDAPTYQLMRNPDVTVRSRGVMEKCTYCVQRIQEAKIQSELEGRKVRDGEIVTACQAACPTEAIVFGDINDPNSRVSRMKAEERNYSLLAELNTRPRTTYLASVRNPNPEIKS